MDPAGGVVASIFLVPRVGALTVGGNGAFGPAISVEFRLGYSRLTGRMRDGLLDRGWIRAIKQLGTAPVGIICAAQSQHRVVGIGGAVSIDIGCLGGQPGLAVDAIGFGDTDIYLTPPTTICRLR